MRCDDTMPRHHAVGNRSRITQPQISLLKAQLMSWDFRVVFDVLADNVTKFVGRNGCIFVPIQLRIATTHYLIELMRDPPNPWFGIEVEKETNVMVILIRPVAIDMQRVHVIVCMQEPPRVLFANETVIPEDSANERPQVSIK